MVILQEFSNIKESSKIDAQHQNAFFAKCGGLALRGEDQ